MSKKMKSIFNSKKDIQDLYGHKHNFDFKIYDLYTKDEDIVSSFVKQLQSDDPYIEKYIVIIKQKYDWQDEYDYLSCELERNDAYDLIWEWDWNEGQTDYEFIYVVTFRYEDDEQ